ncbi:hypothetical protein ACTA71_002341 [Dictyostelium dimigraforme]
MKITKSQYQSLIQLSQSFRVNREYFNHYPSYLKNKLIDYSNNSTSTTETATSRQEHKQQQRHINTNGGTSTTAQLTKQDTSTTPTSISKTAHAKQQQYINEQLFYNGQSESFNQFSSIVELNNIEEQFEGDTSNHFTPLPNQSNKSTIKFGRSTSPTFI